MEFLYSLLLILVSSFRFRNQLARQTVVKTVLPSEILRAGLEMLLPQTSHSVAFCYHCLLLNSIVSPIADDIWCCIIVTAESRSSNFCIIPTICGSSKLIVSIGIADITAVPWFGTLALSGSVSSNLMWFGVREMRSTWTPKTSSSWRNLSTNSLERRYHNYADQACFCSGLDFSISCSLLKSKILFGGNF